MAVDKLKKIEILGYRNLREEVIASLQKLGVVQVIDFTESNLEVRDLVERRETDTRDVDIKLQQITYILNFLKGFEEKKGLLDTLTEAPKVVDQAALTHLVQTFNLSEYYQRCQEQEARINTLHSREARIKTDLEFWQPWKVLTVDVRELEGCGRYGIMTGTVDAGLLAPLTQELEGSVAEVDITEITTVKSKAYLLIIFLVEVRDRLLDVLRRYEFQEVKLSVAEESKTGIPAGIPPAGIIDQLQNQLKAIQADFESWHRASQDLLKEKESCQILHDYYLNLQKRQKISDLSANTREVFSLIGWLRAQDEEKVLRTLERDFSEIDISIHDPGPDESPPVVLVNSKLVSPFEMITSLYGLPRYQQIDPTPLLAPFFFLFFGLCLGDAGYGFILSLTAILALRSFHLKEGSRKLMQVFFLCGLSTIMCGIFTGGWFGDLVSNYLPLASLQHFTKKLTLMDPIKDPLTFLIFTLSLGFIQVWFGMSIQMYKHLREKDWQNAFLSRLPWLILLPGIILLLVVSGGKLQGPVWSAVAKWSSLLSAATIVLFEGRDRDNIFSRVGVGLLALYGIVGYYADMLSYCRLLALGLASAIIANVVNQIAFMTVKIPYAGIIIMASIFVVGHLFNLVINLLGAFVHPSRLQFIEFFTKFFEGGGKPFMPFAIESKYVVIK
ncbi:MAG: V-type ATP synthase subunit I [bacterium]